MSLYICIDVELSVYIYDIRFVIPTSPSYIFDSPRDPHQLIIYIYVLNSLRDPRQTNKVTLMGRENVKPKRVE